MAISPLVDIRSDDALVDVTVSTATRTAPPYELAVLTTGTLQHTDRATTTPAFAHADNDRGHSPLTLSRLQGWSHFNDDSVQSFHPGWCAGVG